MFIQPFHGSPTYPVPFPFTMCALPLTVASEAGSAVKPIFSGMESITGHRPRSCWILSHKKQWGLTV
jgi:hypothetical protein